MAMLPFCGYHMGDYFRHWLAMGERLGDHAPLIFGVNWFRKKDGKLLWPGYGENMRVLKWIVERARGKGAVPQLPGGTTFGFPGVMPSFEDLELNRASGAVDVSPECYSELMRIDADGWRQELEEHARFFETLGDRLPAKFTDIREQARQELDLTVSHGTGSAG